MECRPLAAVCVCERGRSFGPSPVDLSALRWLLRVATSSPEVRWNVCVIAAGYINSFLSIKE